MKLTRDQVPAAAWQALAQGAVFHVWADRRRFEISGKGAAQCLQGLVTCDVLAAADGTMLFGALLTPKGMIVTPLWITRHEPTRFLIEAPAAAGSTLADALRRSLPPRLCRWQDVSAQTATVGVYGAGAAVPGRLEGALPCVARGAPGVEVCVGTGRAAEIRAGLAAEGLFEAPAAQLEACRILAGIPALGAEIDDRTLPQEVRLDELGAVSYTKGCYVGQETVARLHFRGHANRRLAALLLTDDPGAPPLQLLDAGRPVGRLTSAAWTEDAGGWFCLAVVRRELEAGREVRLENGVAGRLRLDEWRRPA
jgi:folate-binding protein YgfZ